MFAGFSLKHLPQWKYIWIEFSFGMFMFWFFTVEQDGWDYLGAASGAAGFPLGALAGLIFGYMEMIAKAP